MRCTAYKCLTVRRHINATAPQGGREMIQLCYACLAVVVVFVITPVAQASETQLVCQGTQDTSITRSAGQHTDLETGTTVNESVRIPVKSDVIHEIRFDEQTRTFWYRGNENIGHLKAENGWVPATSVIFNERTIEASFEKTINSKARAVLSFGIDLLINPEATRGQLDRYSGIWSPL